jgi:hypothetical protein
LTRREHENRELSAIDRAHVAVVKKLHHEAALKDGEDRSAPRVIAGLGPFTRSYVRAEIATPSLLLQSPNSLFSRMPQTYAADSPLERIKRNSVSRP